MESASRFGSFLCSAAAAPGFAAEAGCAACGAATAGVSVACGEVAAAAGAGADCPVACWAIAAPDARLRRRTITGRTRQRVLITNTIPTLQDTLSLYYRPELIAPSRVIYVNCVVALPGNQMRASGNYRHLTSAQLWPVLSSPNPCTAFQRTGTSASKTLW